MKKIFKTAVFASALLLTVGCGPGGSSGGNGHSVGGGSSGSTSSPNDINLTQAVANNEIPGFDPTDPLKDQYTAVINYLRSLSITCNDEKALSGPVGVDMQWNDHLANAAFEHSRDMNLSNWYDHDGSGTVNDKTSQDLGLGRGSHFNERIQHNGYTDSVQAENIAMASATYVLPSDYWLHTMEGWMASTHGHCSNIMNPVLTDFGMSEVRSGQKSDGNYYIYWTQDFGGN